MANIAERNVLVRFTADSSRLNKAAKTAGKEISGLQGLAQAAAATIGGIFAFNIAQNTIQGITSLGRSSAQLAINFEQTQVAFETFLGSASAANKVLAELTEFSTLTPFEPEQVISAGQALLAFGVEADDLTSTLGKLGDISAGTGTNFNELAQLFGKAKVQGRLFGEDINQLTGRGIPVIAEFAKQFGVADSEVKKLVSSGKIGFPELEKAFTSLTSEGGKFFDLTAKQSQTVAGRISTLTGNFNELLKSIGTNLLPVIGALVDQFNRFVTLGRDLVKTQLSDELEKQSLNLSVLTLELQDVNTSQERRVAIINELKKEYPGLLDSIDAETASNEELIPTLIEINKLLVENIVIQRQRERVNKQAENAAIAVDEQLRSTRLALQVLAPIQREFADELNLTGLNLQQQAEQLINVAKEAGKFSTEIRQAEKFLEILEIQTGVTSAEQERLAIQTKILADLEKDQSDAAKELADSNIEVTDTIKKETTETGKLTKAQKEQLKILKALTEAQRDFEQQAELDIVKGIQESEERRKKALEQRAKAEAEINKTLTDAAREDEEAGIEDSIAFREKAASDILDAQLRAAQERRNAILLADESTEKERLEAQDQFAIESELIEVQRLQARLLVASDVNEFLNTQQEIQDKLTEIEMAGEERRKKVRDDAREKNLEVLDTIVKANQAAAQAINQIGEALFGAEIERLDKRIEAQEKAVNKAVDNIEEGGAEQVEAEERRLAALQAQRDRAAQNLAVTSAIEVAANQAVALSASIAAVAAAFAPPGNIVTGIATSIALAATLVSATLAINNAFGQIGAFADGTEYFDGVGGPRSDSNLAMISRGERIVPTSTNERYFDTLNEFQNNTPMADMLHNIAQGRMQLPSIASENRGIRGGNKELLGEMQLMNKRLGRLSMNVTLDKDGFAASMSKYAERKGRLRRKLNG